MMWKPMHSPCDEVYHKMGIRWEKSTHTMGKVWLPIFQVLLMRCDLLHFPMLWDIDVKTYAFPIWWDLLISSCDFHLLKFILEKSIVLHHRINSNSNTFGTIHPRFWIKYETYILQLYNIFHFITRAFT